MSNTPTPAPVVIPGDTQLGQLLHAHMWATDEAEVLQARLELARFFEDLAGDAARKAHDFGSSWAEIGRWVGVTKQAAHQRWGTK